MCGNWNYRSSELAKRLHKDTIRKGGIQQITTPILNCKIASELEEITVEVGGYPTLVNYNKHRETQATIDRFNKKMRSLRRNIKNKKLCQSGLTHRVHNQGIAGGSKS
jgi:hypothetical protein